MSGGRNTNTGSSSAAALLHYLEHGYGEGQADKRQNGPRGGSSYTQRPLDLVQALNGGDASTSPRRRSPSPPDPSVTIPPALAELASTAPAIDLTSDRHPIIDVDLTPDDLDDRGEMGGKRRKPLHERAGWKEMDEQGGVRKRGRRRRGSSGIRDDLARYAGADTGAGTLERDLLEAQREMGLPAELPAVEEQTIATSLSQQITTHGEPEIGEGTDGEGGGKRGKPAVDPSSKEGRAEQNRRAQQAFRRRREEHMKKLESEAAALGPTRRALNETQDNLRDIALSLEASRIENSALRAALRTAATTSGTSILTPDGTLVIHASSAKRETASRTEDIEAAYEVLERQSRELAKQSRAKREA